MGRTASRAQRSQGTTGKSKRRNPAHLTELASRALLVTRDAIANVRDLIENGSALAMLEVRRCEKELDEIERAIDDRIVTAISGVSEPAVRSLLVSLRVITDLERVADLCLIGAERFHQFYPRPKAPVRRLLVSMTTWLQTMLAELERGFEENDPSYARSVIHGDEELDRMRRKMLSEIILPAKEQELTQTINLLIMVQVFERAGDHLKNVAEELFYLVEGRSLRHLSARKRQEELSRFA
jgi:phosphate transport system protein